MRQIPFENLQIGDIYKVLHNFAYPDFKVVKKTASSITIECIKTNYEESTPKVFEVGDRLDINFPPKGPSSVWLINSGMECQECSSTFDEVDYLCRKCRMRLGLDN